MSIYSTEITRLNGDLMAFVRIQNDWTATIISQNGRKHIVADGTKKDVTIQCEDFLRKEEQIKVALDWYKKTKW